VTGLPVTYRVHIIYCKTINITDFFFRTIHLVILI
jgi:hypothetical protein